MYAQTRAYPYPKMSHVIPSRLFHDLNCDRWNCNVFSDAKKSEGTQITCDFRGDGDEAGGDGDEVGGEGAPGLQGHWLRVVTRWALIRRRRVEGWAVQ